MIIFLSLGMAYGSIYLSRILIYFDYSKDIRMNTMFHLPPPPKFILPPPPMLPRDVFNSKTLLQLTCTSIRSNPQQINPHSILISCIIFFIIVILITLSFTCFQTYRRQRTFVHTLNSRNLSMYDSRTLFLRPDSLYHAIPLG